MTLHKNEDPVTSDPSSVDWNFPPAMVPLTINSQGANLNGIIYVSHGPGPHPTAILLHGYPFSNARIALARLVTEWLTGDKISVAGDC